MVKKLSPVCTVMIPAMKDYLDLYLGMSVHLLAEDTPVKLIEEHIDLAIRLGKLEGQIARVTGIGTLCEGLYAHPDYIKARGDIPKDQQEFSQWDHIASGWQGSPVSYHLPDGTSFKV